jgi:two-component system cell cycle response regulator
LGWNAPAGGYPVVVRVILAHADAAARERFAGVLRTVGHEAMTVSSADAAVEQARASAPDVVLMDVTLGDVEAMVAALKRDAEAYRAAVVLVERAGLDLDAALAALRGGVQDFLVEPVEDAELIARVESAGRTKGLQEELVVQSRRLEALIFEDPLTGLSNRRFILTQLAGQLSGARRHGRPFSVAMLDIDHFKAVNDRFGHAAGDQVLAAVTRTLRAHLRAEDQLGRLGGEEFLALLGDTDERAAPAAAEKLRAAVAAAPPRYEGVELAVTVSVGWASWDGEEPDELLRRADDALYQAKRAGRNRIEGAPATLPRRI